MYKSLAIVLTLLLLNACTEKNFIPKPIAYPRINLPELTSYQVFSANCPYLFEYPNYTLVVSDSFFFENKIVSKCWINLTYPSLNAKVHFSYKEIGKDITIEKVMEDAHELVYAHSKKADFIDEYEIANSFGVEGLMTDIGGDAANNLQFYLTDYKFHYLRGAVYFDSHPNVDSLQPALDFVKQDMLHLFETFEWR
jgi:gliding motility-associated lipoprotein GldD